MNYVIDSIQSLSFSHKAELSLINLLLYEIDEFDYEVRRCLAQYPGSSLENKIRGIIKISKLLLKDHYCSIDLKCFETFERFLRAAGKRDHFIHQFEVFLLGWAILRYYFKIENDTENIRDKFNWWLITALSHDIGYPVKASIDISKKLENIYNNRNTNSISKIFNNSYTNLSNKLHLSDKYVIRTQGGVSSFVNKALYQIIKSRKDSKALTDCMKKELNHGYNSALLLYDGLFFEGKKEKIIHDTNASLACSAIILHSVSHKTHPNIIDKIDIKENPFAYVLYLVDCLQEWDRPDDIDSNYPEFILDDFKIISSTNTIKIKFILKHNNWNEYLVNEQIEYISKKEEIINSMNTKNQRFNIKVKYTCTNLKLNENSIGIPKLDLN